MRHRILTLAMLGVVAIALLVIINLNKVELLDSPSSYELTREKVAENPANGVSLSGKKTIDSYNGEDNTLTKESSLLVESGDQIKQGNYLHTIGILKEILQDTGGADPSETYIPPPEVIIEHKSNGNVTFIRLVDTGCVEPNIPYGGIVEVSGIVIEVIPGFAIILNCEHGAHVKHFKNSSQ